jgi:hypothetical protein
MLEDLVYIVSSTFPRAATAAKIAELKAVTNERDVATVVFIAY